ncbi:TlpA disulfide reductase family protein [Arcobacter sp. CECT 8985]|uniref:TlpA family protein disulfide reductase n=1 Tax=Arcobacter sp. CECT 8985 TaxID=1935424 RepID=UPI00100B5ED4|nr:TlpA disulfide reductase family protein [Arcobacter sp. CECT 8985]RXJ87380.1 thioredoxin [Arcobacter sp. CECT 8985]
MQFKKITFLTILSIVLLTGCGDSKHKEEGKVKAEIKTQFQLNNIDGTTININKKDDKVIVDEFKNKVILLDFFATWCEPCQAEIPQLNNLQENYANNFKIISVAMPEKDGSLPTTDSLKEFKEKYNVSYPIVNGKEVSELSQSFGGIKTIPTIMVIDTKGNIKENYIGVVPEEMLEVDIKKALGK